MEDFNSVELETGEGLGIVSPEEDVDGGGNVVLEIKFPQETLWRI